MSAKCVTCGGFTQSDPADLAHDPLCNACWEVESRLEQYLLRGRMKAIVFVNRAVRKAHESL